MPDELLREDVDYAINLVKQNGGLLEKGARSIL
jgi:hypothetical protein